VGSDLTETTADPHPVNHHLLSGRREGVLRKVNGAWKMRRRTIVVDANVLLTRTSESSSKGQNLISLTPLKAKRALAEIDHYDGYCPRSGHTWRVEKMVAAMGKRAFRPTSPEPPGSASHDSRDLCARLILPWILIMAPSHFFVLFGTALLGSDTQL
jgi:hypothetical protein